MTNYISTEHTQVDETETRALVEKLQEWGWDVEYGDGLPWEFESDWERDDFRNAFGAAELAICNPPADTPNVHANQCHTRTRHSKYAPVETQTRKPRLNRYQIAKKIQAQFYWDFGLYITRDQALEVMHSKKDGCAVQYDHRYTTTRGTDDLNQASEKGVHFSAYKTYYTKGEWNRAVKSGEFGEPNNIYI